MSKEELVSYLNEYLNKIKKSRNTMLGDVLGGNTILEKQLIAAKSSVDKIVDIDLNLLSTTLNVNLDVIHKLEKYQYFVTTKYFNLTEEQKIDLKAEISLLLDKILAKNKDRLSFYPEISLLDDEENLVSNLLSRMSMTPNDITWDEYLAMVKILRKQDSLYAKDLLKRLSAYMNYVILNEKRSKYQSIR